MLTSFSRILCVLALAPSGALAQTPPSGLPAAKKPEEVGMDGARLQAAFARLEREVVANRLKGAVALVARRGKVVLHRAVGVADLAGKRPLRLDTQFKMASNTKPVTASAVMMLVKEGRLALDAPVARYLPAWSEGDMAKITLRHLLTHTSGLRIPTLFLQPLMKKSAAHPDAPSLRLECDRFAAVGPAVKPGTTYSYSNPGFNTLAALVEVASGMPFADFVAKRIYGPLGMKDSGHRESKADAERMSEVFHRHGDSWSVRWRPQNGDVLPFVRGSGGMVSTAADYGRFCQWFLQDGRWEGEQLLPAAMIRTMTRPQVDSIPAATRYGLGWSMRDDSGCFMHGGSDGTFAGVDPDQQLVCLVFTQSMGAAQRPAATFFAAVRRAVVREERPNILMITADDLNRSSVGVYGGKVPGVTPHIDALAAQGMRFDHAHVNIAVCQPSRAVMMTGRYPHHNGARGFQPIRRNVPTLSGLLADQGYVTGIFGKTRHVKPDGAFRFAVSVPRNDLGEGRNPDRYAAAAKAFFQRVKKADKPFFLMANCHDPHRPFAGSRQEIRQRKKGKKFPGATRTLTPDEVQVPGFLPSIGPVQKEIAQYFTSVHRADQVVGRLLAELDAAGLADNTLVLFLSDNGMALPFAKTNVYLHSTATPWIVRWPGRIAPGTVDDKHMISAVDWLPTALEAAGLPVPPKVDGRSILPLLRGGSQKGRDEVLTFFYETSARKAFPMRCLQTRRWGLIVNDWADGTKRFRNESMNGLTFRAMQAKAEEDPEVAARVRLFLHRCREELFDFRADPDALRNLASDPQHAEDLGRMRKRLAAKLKAVKDPDAARFAGR